MVNLPLKEHLLQANGEMNVKIFSIDSEKQSLLFFEV